MLITLDILIAVCLQATPNSAVKELKIILVKPSDGSAKASSWCFQNFIPNEEGFGSSVLSVAPGTFMVGQKVCLIDH